jgi:hypothetical protein
VFLFVLRVAAEPRDKKLLFRHRFESNRGELLAVLAEGTANDRRVAPRVHTVPMPTSTGNRSKALPGTSRRRRGIVRRRYPALQGGQERVDVHVRQFPRVVGGGRVRARVAV